MSLFARNPLLKQERDGFLSLYLKFVNSIPEVKELYIELDVPILTEEDIDKILSQYDLSKWNIDIKGYLLYKQKILRKECNL